MATVDTTFTRRKILRDELVGLYGVVERNLYLTKRYFLWDLAFLLWTIANTLTIVFIARGVDSAPAQQNELATKLLVGGVIWAFLGIIFEIVTETVAWERWEGTIEYTFMAPVSRSVHLIGMGVYAVLYGLVRAAAIFVAVVAFIDIHLPLANYGAAVALLAIASVSFIGVGMMTAVLPLISPEKGTQLGFVAQGLMLVVSGVYYPVSVLPEWMQWIAKISPATYALRGSRNSILHGAGLAWDDVWPLLVIGRVLDPDRPDGLQGRRALRQEARQAEAVRMIELRVAETDADLDVWAQVKSRVVAERAGDRRPASRPPASRTGCCCSPRSTARSPAAGSRTARASAAAPSWRRASCRSGVGRGVGYRARPRSGRSRTGARADRRERVRLRRRAALDRVRERFGLAEVDYQLEQIRAIGAEPEPAPIEGIEVVPLDGRRDELLVAVWPLALAGYAELPLPGDVSYTLEAWLQGRGDASGRLVRRAPRTASRSGFAGLIEHANGPAIAEHGLTVVRGDCRGRGIARAAQAPPARLGRRAPASPGSSPGRRRATRRCRP